MKAALVLALALVLVVGGCGVAMHSIDQADALAHKGVHVKATIERAHNRDSMIHNPDPTVGRLRVTYVAGDHVERNIRIWLPEGTNYRVGQRVEIAYDRKDPRHAVLARGGDPGPLALVSVCAFLLGLCIVYAVWKDRRAAGD